MNNVQNITPGYRRKATSGAWAVNHGGGSVNRMQACYRNVYKPTIRLTFFDGCSSFLQGPNGPPDFRYKSPFQLEIFDNGTAFNNASESMRFSSGLAAFAMILRDSQFKGSASFEHVLDWLNNASTYDPHSYRKQLMDVVEKTSNLK